MNEEKYIKPCKMADELYCIGVSGSPAHLLVTDDGLVIIDTGRPAALEVLLKNIELIGFNIKDVKHIIHTHGHIDHIGCTKAFLGMCNAKTYIGKFDADAANGKNDFVWDGTPGRELSYAFEPDVLIDDGDIIKIGNTEIRFVHTPGHTAGVISPFFKVHYKGKEYLAGMHGGVGYNTLTDEYLDKFSLPKTMRDEFIKGIDKIIDEPVDLHVGNHHSNNKHSSKMARMTEDYNPFIEEKTWRPFLEKTRAGLVELYNLNY